MVPKTPEDIQGMTPSQKVLVNMLASYGRSVLAAGLAIFSSRWVLTALGQSDYGLFSVVGSIILVVTFINGVMTGATIRHYAFWIGKGDEEELKKWFNSVLTIHLALAVILVGFGYFAGEFAISHVLRIPPGREDACQRIFQISLISAFVSITSVPYSTMFLARQKITETAFWGIVNSTLNFILAWVIQFYSGDRLTFYSMGMTAAIVVTQLGLLCRSAYLFKSCSIDFSMWGDKKRLREIFGFAGWNLFGSLGVSIRDQGSAILLNHFHGPRVNAAFGIANQVSTQVNQLSNSMIGAFSPEIIASEGRGDRSRVLSLSNRASKFGTFLVLLFAAPLILEMDYVLKIWLHTPPQYAASFCRFILCAFLIDRLTVGQMMAVYAKGLIAEYQVKVGLSLICSLPISWCLLKAGWNPFWVGASILISMIICSVWRVQMGGKLLGQSSWIWIKQVLVKTLVTTAICFACAGWARYLLPEGFIRLTMVGIIAILIILTSAWYLSFDASERKFASESFGKIFTRIKNSFSKKNK